jgi:hypothetical protein
MRRIPAHISDMHRNYLRLLAGWRTGHGSGDLTAPQCRDAAGRLSRFMREENWTPLLDGSLYDAEPDICSQ